MRLPTPWRNLVAAVDEVDPGGGALQLPIDRFLEVVDVILEQGHPLRALPGFDPNASLIRVHLTIAIRADTTAWSVAKIFRATHWAAEAGRVQNALATHLAIPDGFFERLLDGEREAL
jgi:hypothetical protein